MSRCQDGADLLYEAWVVIANTSEGRWDQQTPEWQQAATRWRDDWHAHLARNRAMPRCACCGCGLVQRRKDARYCSGGCRKKAWLNRKKAAA